MRQPAFRGIPFTALDISEDVGRRVAVHEYPQRDTPYVEDMGRRARNIRLTAVVHGPAYATQRDALIAACETKGAGELLHPTRGALMVYCLSCQVTQDVAGIDSASFALEFLEAGELRYPTQVAEPAGLAAIAAAAAVSPLQQVFTGLFDAASGDIDAIQSAAAGIRATVTRYRAALLVPSDLTSEQIADLDEALSDIDAAAETLAQTPSDLADAWATVILQIQALPILDAVTIAGPPSSGDQNTAAHDRYVHSLAVAQGSSAAVAYPWATADAGEAATATWSGRLLATAECDPSLHPTMIALHARFVAAMAEETAQLPRLTTYAAQSVRCAAELAQSLYDDPNRAAEIARLNGIPHPLFVSAETLQVLSE